MRNAGLGHLAAALTLILAGLFPVPTAAQIGAEPTRIVFPFAAGGSGDALARLIAEHLRVALDQPVIVENRAGAQGRIGVQAVKATTPDGKTLLLTPVAPMSIYSPSTSRSPTIQSSISSRSRRSRPSTSPSRSARRCRRNRSASWSIG
jgi:tripartite-type tricarboxylate transporter receptor subunit TctC